MKPVYLVSHEVVRCNAMPCVGLAYIAAYLQSKGIRVEVFDTNYLRQSPYDVLRDKEPGIVGITCEARNFEEAVKIASFAKQKGHITVLGGLHISLIEGQILDYTDVDFAVTGDGEIPLYQLVQAINEGKTDFSSIPGLIFRQDGAVKVNPQTRIENLDDLPYPDYGIAKIKNIEIYPIITSRGCPYKCKYCTVGSISRGRWQPRSVKNIIGEIKHAIEKHNIKEFIIIDENFSQRMDRAVEFCKSMIEEGINIPWSVMEGMRADKIDREVLKLLKKAGCDSIYFGIETVENSELEHIAGDKKMLVINRAVRLAHEEGFKVCGYFVVGLPGATYKTVMNSVNFAKKNLDIAIFWMAIPYLNTPLYQEVITNHKLLRKPVGINVINSLSTKPFFETKVFSRKEMKKAHVVANLEVGNYYFIDNWKRYESVSFLKRLIPRIKLIVVILHYHPTYIFRFIKQQIALRLSRPDISPK
jgi:anaerobic magnesium-protoporphyrin IX monomethyl ester cyclase